MTGPIKAPRLKNMLNNPNTCAAPISGEVLATSLKSAATGVTKRVVEIPTRTRKKTNKGRGMGLIKRRQNAGTPIARPKLF
jgi:hypothetical protein